MEKNKESLINKIKRTIEKNDLINQGERILIACSGGADSVAMTEALRILSLLEQWHIFVCHVNHNIRGEEAQQDALWVGNFCHVRGLDFCIENVDVPSFAKEEKYSTEEAARILRYRALQKVAEEKNLSKIAVAHNLDDNAETIVMNILRGSGLDGLTGIKVKRDNIIRPMLEISRKEIEDFCANNTLNFCTDSSNNERKHLRNKVRLDLVPVLKRYNPSVSETLCRLSSILEKDAILLNQMAFDKYNSIALEKEDAILLPLEKLALVDKAFLPRIFSLTIKNLIIDGTYINTQHLYQIQELLERGRTGAVLDLPNELKVKRSYDALVFSTKSDEQTQVVSLEQVPLPVPGRVVLPDRKIIRASIFRGSKPRIVENQKSVIFPAYVAQHGLVIRPRQNGDVFQPSGMNGNKQKLKQFFIDNKVPQEERDNIPLVCDEEGILWITGLRFAHREYIDTDSWLYLELIDKEYLNV